MPPSVPTARTNILATLTALQATTLSGVAVARTDVWGARPEREFVIVRPAEDITWEWQNLGNGPASRMEERYTIPIRVEVFSSTQDVAVAEARRWTVANTVLQALLTDVTLGGAVHYFSPGSPSEDTQPIDETRIVAGLTVNLDCFAQSSLRS